MKKAFLAILRQSLATFSIFVLVALPAMAQIIANPDQSAVTKTLADEQRSRRSIFGSAAGFQNIDLRQLVAIVVQAMLSLLAMLFLVLIIYGGYVWMMARGNENEVQRAKTIIRNSIIGLIVLMSSYAIGYFILYYLATAGQGPNAPLGA